MLGIFAHFNEEITAGDRQRVCVVAYDHDLFVCHADHILTGLKLSFGGTALLAVNIAHEQLVAFGDGRYAGNRRIVPVVAERKFGFEVVVQLCAQRLGKARCGAGVRLGAYYRELGFGLIHYREHLRLGRAGRVVAGGGHVSLPVVLA